MAFVLANVVYDFFSMRLIGGNCHYARFPFPTTGKYSVFAPPEELDRIRKTVICKTNYIGLALNIIFPILFSYLALVKKMNTVKWLFYLWFSTLVFTIAFNLTINSLLQVID